MESRLAAGDLRQRIAIETPTATQDAAGQPIRTWATLSGCSSLPAKVESVTGGESIRGRNVAAEAQLAVTIRYRTDITTAMRVVYDAQRYGIVRASDPYGDQRELRIEAAISDGR